MCVRNAAVLLKKMRRISGMTQEEFAEGICSTVTLSKFENGSRRISKKYFDLFCKKAGVKESFISEFASVNDFLIARNFKNVRLCLTCGNDGAALKYLLMCKDIDNSDIRLKAEFLLLVSSLFRNINKFLLDAQKYVCQAFEGMNLSEISTDRYTSVLQFEVYIYRYMYEESYLMKERFNSLTAVINDSPLNKYEKDYLKMSMYALLSFSCASCNDLSNSKEYAKKSKIYAVRSQKYCHLFTVREMITNDKDFKWSAKDVFLAFGKSSELEDDKLLYLKKMSDDLKFTNRSDCRSFTIGKALKYYRNISDVPIEKAINGICSKSNYYRMESDILMPSPIVFRTIIERLGYSMDTFVYWGNETEMILDIPYGVKKIKTDEAVPDKMIRNENIPEFSEGIFYEQLKGFIDIEKQKCSDKKIIRLWNILNKTLSGISFSTFNAYHFSCLEMMILNNISFSLIMCNRVSESICLLEKQLSYYRNTIIDLSYSNTVFPTTVMLYSYALFREKKFDKIIEFVESREYDIYLYDLHVTLFIMEIYALCLKKIKKDNCFVVKLIKVFKDYFPEELNFELSDALGSVLL